MPRHLPRVVWALAWALVVVFVATVPASARSISDEILREADPAGQAVRTDRLWLSSSELDALLQETEDSPLGSFDEFGGGSNAPRRWWPLALSALVPGLGEAATGHIRGYFMIAADAGGWLLAKNANDEGNDKEEEFEAFALENWSEEEWERALFPTDGSEGAHFDYFSDLRDASSKEDIPLYVSREEDEREWFENAGKWDIFYWGWRDVWDAPFFNPGDPDDPDYSTPLRQQYLDLRGESNDAFGRRDTFVTINLALRVASVLQVAYLEGFIGGRHNASQGPSSSSRGYSGGGGAIAGIEEPAAPQLSWFVSPQGFRETRVGLKLRY